jgi:hypothetical protein
MDLMQQVYAELYRIRAERVQFETIDVNDPEAINKLIADAINALENLFMILNLPRDGFVPNTPSEE